MNTIQGKVILALVAAVFGLGYAVVYFYRTAQDAEETASFAAAMGKQNELALQQQLQQKADSIQNLALRVTSLNRDKGALQKENKLYVAMTESLKIVIKTISAAGSGTARDGTDSVGAYGEVAFSGKKSFIRFSGFTRRYADKSSYRLDLFPDIIDIYSDVIRDTDNIWKIRVRSGTEGVELKVFSVLDSSLFRQVVAPPHTDPLPLFSLALEGAVQAGTDGTLKFSPGVEAQYRRQYFLRYYPLQKMFFGGIRINILEF